MPHIAYNSTQASKALSLTKSQFLALVDEGVLPKPRKLGPYERWDAQELQATLRGERVSGYEDVKW